MKRDKTLQRLLLTQVRDGKEPSELAEYPEQEQVYNSALLINDGYVSGEAIRGADGDYVTTVMTELTSKGQDVLPFIHHVLSDLQAPSLSVVLPHLRQRKGIGGIGL